MFRIPKRNIWKVSDGKAIGYVKEHYKGGLFFSPHYIAVREANANIPHAKVEIFSIEYLKNKQDVELYMKNKTPVCIEYEKHLVGFPTKGYLRDPLYAINITPLETN